LADAVIDVHSHIYPRAYLQLLKERVEVPRVVADAGAERFVIFAGERGRVIGPDYWDIAAKLAFMDQAGIQRTVVSLGNPWLDPFPPAQSRELAVVLNDELARLDALTNGRLVGLGILPASSVAEAADVVREIARVPSLRGIMSGTRPCGLLLDDPALELLWEALEVTRLPLFLHPHYGSAVEECQGYGIVLQLALGFPFETTIALSRLILRRRS